MLDFERLPEWQRAVKSASVLSRDSDGRAREVAYEIDVRVAVVRYTLRHIYEPPRRIGSAYVEGDFRDCEGEWTFDDLGNGSTQAGFRLRIDPGRIIPRPVVRMLNSRVMKGSMDDLQRHYAGRR
jgi:ribosome-associated toxin RatA of RatAB toxin-antitoxin module